MFHDSIASQRKRIPVLLMFLLSISLAADTAHAAFSLIGFELCLSSKEAVLENPDDMMIMKYSAWDVAAQRIADRNMPFLELTNNSNSEAPITEFNMTIGDTRFNFSDVFFGDFIRLGDSTPGFDLQASTENGDLPGDMLRVVINPGVGLLPGETVRFRVDIGVDPGFPDLFPHQDFRLVFFDMFDNNDPANNSIVTSIFADGAMTGDVSTQLPNFASENDEFFNNNIRPGKVMEGVDRFCVEAQIPEPSGIALLTIGTLAGLMVRRRLRK